MTYKRGPVRLSPPRERPAVPKAPPGEILCWKSRGFFREHGVSGCAWGSSVGCGDIPFPLAVQRPALRVFLRKQEPTLLCTCPWAFPHKQQSSTPLPWPARSRRSGRTGRPACPLAEGQPGEGASVPLPRKRQSRKSKAMVSGLLLWQEQAWTAAYAAGTYRPLYSARVLPRNSTVTEHGKSGAEQKYFNEASVTCTNQLSVCMYSDWAPY